ncbi:hypothetical protein [Pedobacter sp. MC2016-24]|uniref:hypothetical protein n=1 Tax=Pedobacter sp. MC2016-24 TaxID=2780090 RepID=UPI00187E9E59|nr:hypothetical protein [Pedobacter sp. MC2016-24]MBE9600831.1 hypothetical protein [Pedobacter sp. MC2016-24]
MLKKTITYLFLIIGMTGAQAQSTRLIIRAKAKDAKFIGTGIGGAYIIVKNHLTGEILAKGLTSGASGNTDLIMKKPVSRWQSITDSTTAKFEANLSIAEPTFVDIEVLAPVNRKNAAVKASTQTWLIPGKDITGDGIVVEIPGLILDVLYPNTHEVIKSDTLKNAELKFRASLTLMCGCPISKAGVWNSDDIDIQAIVKKEGVLLQTAPLGLTGHTNIFEGKIKIKSAGNYELTIYAIDRKTGNTGVDKINFVIQ